MSNKDKFDAITTDAYVEIYQASNPIFEGLFDEVSKLSSKKPDATISPAKVKMINRVLEDLLGILKNEPAGKYLDLIDDVTLPQVSDVLLAMVQFKSTLKAFRARHYRYVDGDKYWITDELLAGWDANDELHSPDDDDND